MVILKGNSTTKGHVFSIGLNKSSGNKTSYIFNEVFKNETFFTSKKDANLERLSDEISNRFRLRQFELKSTYTHCQFFMLNLLGSA
ncbi:hypothetical protein DID80_05280 [Candidatus Marinamargulisbacteria bacterium SCGC AAA071-K20]|nr:hypothetical protein DID80_05280 [Candidatus Marinamargulisbacteria bacterium SCGC AAA071-K20]